MNLTIKVNKIERTLTLSDPKAFKLGYRSYLYRIPRSNNPMSLYNEAQGERAEDWNKGWDLAREMDTNEEYYLGYHTVDGE